MKREYFRFLKEADRKANGTIDAVRKAINRYEEYTGYADVSTFNKERAVAFKKHLAKSRGCRTGEPMATSTLIHTTSALKGFFRWLTFQPGYKSKLRMTDIEYLNLSEKETRRRQSPA